MNKPVYHILLVDDDDQVRDALSDFFESEGFLVTAKADGDQALVFLQNHPKTPDLVVLDVTLPGLSGFDVLEKAQEIEGFSSPIMMLSGRGEQEAILKGLGLGADDYLTKPFNADELMARVRAVLQRTQPPSRTPMSIYTIGDLTINFSTHQASRNGEPVQFTALEYDILLYLIQHKNQTVTRRQLLVDVWGIDQDIVTRTIDRHMASVRKKVEVDATIPQFIETVYGIGYRFNG